MDASVDIAREHEQPRKAQCNQSHALCHEESDTDDVKKWRQLGLVGKAVADEQALCRLILIFPELGNLDGTLLDGLFAADTKQSVEANDEREMRNHRPENRGLFHEVPLESATSQRSAISIN